MVLDNTQSVTVNTVPADLKSLVIEYLLKAITSDGQSGIQAVQAPINKLTHTLSQIAEAPGATVPEKIWASSRYVNDVNKQVAVPTMLAMRLLMDDPVKRNQLSQNLSQLSAITAAPSVGARTADAASKVFGSKDPIQALGDIAPTTMLKNIGDLSPSIVHYLSQMI